MPDHEFDTYLTLLASLLKLDRRQRGKIAEELRSHLEDRLDELLAEGRPREEAIQQALAEFGDAAGLAAEFKTLSSGRKRRWLMRVTTFSVAATLLLAAGIVTFWPGRNAGPGVAQLGAQDVEKMAEPEGNVAAAQGQTLDEKLNALVDFDFVEVPFKDAIHRIATATDVRFVVNTKRLKDAGFDVNRPVSKSIKDVRLRTFLDLLLRDFELGYIEHEDALVRITTTEEAEMHTFIRIYDCRDLLSMPSPQNDYEKRVNSLVQVVERSVLRATWEPVGGPASLNEFSGLLVIAQNREGHKQVESFLDMLREAASVEKTADGGVR
jgi:hypothetical protein